MRLIGIIDFDFISTRELCSYNFGVLLTSSYYKIQGSKVRLIIDLKYDNLLKYDKIYIFKSYKTKVYPINLIENYYSLPVEEYGEGFENRPLFPDLPNFIYTPINMDVYMPIINYIERGGKNFLLSKKWSTSFKPTLLFFEHEEEVIAREYPKNRRLLLYDNPLILFNTEIGAQKLKLLERNGHQIKFIKPIRIGLVSPAIYDWLSRTKLIVGFQNDLYAEEDDKYLEEFMEWCRQTESPITLTLLIKTKNGIDRFSKRGGKIYERKTIKKFNTEGTTTKNAEITNTTRVEWFTKRESNKRSRADRERDYKEKERRRRFLPSEYEKRDRDRRIRNRSSGFGR